MDSGAGTIPGEASQRDRPWLLLALAMIAVLAFGLWLSPDRINCDCAYLLQMGDAMLDGQIPYVDFVDANPPLIMYLQVPPALISRTIGIPLIVSFHLMTLALLTLSAVELYWLMRQPRFGLDATERGILLTAWIALYFIVDVTCSTGQREHLFLLSFVPYLCLRILRHRGGNANAWFAAILGVQAGLGASLKPHFLLAPAAVEIALLLLSRRWRTLLKPEIFGFAAFVSAYVVHWLFVPAAMREAFFHRWLPLFIDHYAGMPTGCTSVGGRLVRHPVCVVALCFTLAAIPYCYRRRTRLRHHLAAFTALAAASLTVAFVQHKGYDYHYVPFEAAGLTCGVLAILVVGKPNHRFALHCGMISLMLIVIGWWGFRECAPAISQTTLALRRTLLNHSRPGDRVLCIVPSFCNTTSPLLLQIGRKPGGRYPYMLPIRMIYNDPTLGGPAGNLYHALDVAPPEEREYLNDLREDVTRNHPRLIVIQDRIVVKILPYGFNAYEYLVFTGWTADMLSSYREVTAPKGWKVFERRETDLQAIASNTAGR